MSPLVPVSSTAVPASNAPATSVEAENPDAPASFDATLSARMQADEASGTAPGSEAATAEDKVEAVEAAIPGAPGGNSLPPALPAELLATILPTMTPNRVGTERFMSAAGGAGGDNLAALAATEEGLISAARSGQQTLSPALPGSVLPGLPDGKIPGAPAAQPDLKSVALSAVAEGATEFVATPDTAARATLMEAVADKPVFDAVSPAVAGTPRASEFVMALPGPNGPQSFSAPTPMASVPARSVIEVPVPDARWGESFGQRVLWSTNQGFTSAELHLSPPDLGPVSVRIQVDQGQASIGFVAPHAATREAIEAALPRLREMFAAQGMVLADASVSQQGPSPDRQPAADGWNGGRRDETGEPDQAALRPLSPQRLGMLDVFA